ncbi:MAG: carcinine hydrolase/isopenicillin-N N-acyltransferase family protein, partial [Myxococcota bacterium]
HHFALLDAGSAHKHVVVFTHEPEDGIPHVTVGWAGMVGGFSGMNAEGLVWSVNHADTLDNPVVGEVRRDLVGARLLSSGLPITMTGREVLQQASDVDAATDIILDSPSTVGWTHLVAGEGGLRVAERSADIMGRGDQADHVYDPARRDSLDSRLASEGPDDLRAASHFESNTEDIDLNVLTFHLTPQRYWSPWWHRSVRAFNILGDMMDDAMGELDAERMIEILRTDSLVHDRDSMNAVVYEPELMKLWLAAGVVPATDGPFEEHDVAELLGVSR